MVQKRKRWPLVTVVAASLITIVSLGVYLAYPYISKAAGSDRNAMTALKTEGQKIKEEALDSVNYIKENLTAGKNEYKGTLQLSKLTLDGVDYMSGTDAVDYNMVDYDIQADMAGKKLGVSANLKSDSSSASGAESVKLYADTDKLYVQMPDRLSSPVTMSLAEGFERLGIGEYYGEFTYALSELEPETISEYAGVAERIIGYMSDAYDSVVEKAQYESLGETTVDATEYSAGSVIKVNRYKVKISTELLGQEFEKMVNAIYSDVKLAGYMSLFNAASGVSRSSLITGLENKLLWSNGLEAEIWVDHDNRLVELQMEGFLEDKLTVAMYGGSEPWDDRIVLYAGKDSQMQYRCTGSQDKSIELDLSSTSAGNSVNIKLSATLTGNGKECKVNNLELDSVIDGKSITLAGSGSCIKSQFSVMTLTGE